MLESLFNLLPTVIGKILSKAIDANFYPTCLIFIRYRKFTLTSLVGLLTYGHANYFSNVFRSEQDFVAKNSSQISKYNLKHKNTKKTQWCGETG